MFQLPKVTNDCAFDSLGNPRTSGNAYMLLVFLGVLGVLNQTMILKREYPDNLSRNALHIALQVGGIVLYVRYALKCRGLTGFLIYIGAVILGSAVINIVLPTPPQLYRHDHQ